MAAPPRPFTLRALAGSTDEFGRLHFLLVDETKNGKDSSADFLAKVVGDAPRPPFRLRKKDAGGVVGEFWATAPKGNPKFWSDELRRLQGREVRVELTKKYYNFPGDDGVTYKGVALKLITFDALDAPNLGPPPKKK